MFRKFTMVTGLLWALLHGSSAVAGVNDIKPSPILNLLNGISFELIDSIKANQVPVDAMFVTFTEEYQKHFPKRIDQRYTPLCAAAFMGSNREFSDKKLRAVKELVALGADVNAHCIDGQYIRSPLELAYGGIPAQQDKDSDVTRALKEAGAEVSAAWKDWMFNEQARTAYRNEESQRQTMENLRLLGSIAMQVIQGAGDANSSIDARAMGDLLVNSANGVAYQDNLARRPDDPALVRMLESLRKTPTNKNVHAFFQTENEGKAWCAGTQPLHLVIDALNAANARLQNMIPCRCEKASSTKNGMPFVCGLMYADAPKK